MALLMAMHDCAEDLKRHRLTQWHHGTRQAYSAAIGLSTKSCFLYPYIYGLQFKLTLVSRVYVLLFPPVFKINSGPPDQKSQKKSVPEKIKCHF